ncbi:MAG: sugar-binding transcriptional regulator [Oscillospiraceae bacterium]|nr:sugar-binding transcriptional regulator [Oscillospiraceae bacterium]
MELHSGAVMNYEEILMEKAAWYYYHEDMTQQQISGLLGLSRMKVIKLLEQAKLCGLIQFRFRQDSEKRLQLEQRLMECHDLQDCFIVPSPPSPAETNENVARAASLYIAGRISAENFINIGYGDTAGRVLNHLAIASDRTISCVSLTGGVSHYLPNARSSVFNSRLYLIPTPLLVSSDEVAAAMKKEKAIQDIQALIPLSTLSVVGIGALNEDATMLTSGVLTSHDFLVLKRNGAVGDILSHFIDENGAPVSTVLEGRTISTDLETLKKLNNVIGVAAGPGKVQAIRAVLRGGYLDVLITDEDTALALAGGSI